MSSIEQNRNLNQLTQARQLQAFYNANTDENTTFDDVSVFLPHPDQWLLHTEDRKVNISRQAAIEFLQTYTKFNSEVLYAFDDWVRDIQIIATM